MNGKLVIENEVKENEIKVRTKYCVDIAVVDKAQNAAIHYKDGRQLKKIVNFIAGRRLRMKK